MSDRIPAWAYWMEREFGEKVPVCRECRSEDLTRNYARASYWCGGCGLELSDHFGVEWVPKDERARRPEETVWGREQIEARRARRRVA